MGIVLSALRMKVRQVDLQSGTTRLMCWLEDRVKRGNIVTLKDEPGREWLVLDVYGVTDVSSINRGWNNNI